jgi:hypothetical protein
MVHEILIDSFLPLHPVLKTEKQNPKTINVEGEKEAGMSSCGFQ